MLLKFLKTHPDAQLPARNHGNRELEFDEKSQALRDFKKDQDGMSLKTCDSGYDVFAVEDTVIPRQCKMSEGPICGRAIVPTGIKVAYITPGYWFKVESRSGLSFKAGILAHPGIVDNQYRGDLGICLYNHSSIDYTVKKGDKIAQLVVYKIYEADVEWAEEVQETLRGEKGFGASGR